MKNILLLCTILLWLCTHAFSGGSIVTKKAADIFLRLDSNIQISVADVAFIKERELEKIIIHRHLNFFERIGFGIAQRKLQKSIRTDGTLNINKLSRFEKKHGNDNSKLEGFALGFCCIQKQE